MELSLHPFDLPLKHRFTISRGSVDVQPTLIAAVSQDGHTGYGECTSNDYYGQTIQHMTEVLENLAPRLAATQLTCDESSPIELWEQLHDGELNGESFAHCALDQAIWDLWGRLRNEPVWQAWGLNPDSAPHSNFTIGIDDIETMAAKLAEEPGWPCYKIKLGADDDVSIIRRLREETDAVFRVDANCGWQADQIAPFAETFRDLNVEFIEQPLPADQWEAMAEAHKHCCLPLAADESCQTESDVARCVDGFDIVNIKLVKCGGLTPARRMILDARQRGLRTMVGCMTESTVGISAIAQLLPMLDFVDMDGANLLARDVATGVRVVRGHCTFNETPGMGVQLNPS